MSDNKRDLLNDLSIDQAQRTTGGGGVGIGTVLLAGVLSAVLGAAAAWWFTRSAAPVTVAIAEVAQLGGARAAPRSPGTSVLDATGYVTARRQATVSSQITGKVVAVLIEEGMQVEEGQLLASLDDANAQASLQLATAQLGESRANLEEVRVLRGEAERNLKRVQDLEARQLASEQDRDAAQADLDTAVARLARLEQAVSVAARAVDVQAQRVADTRILAPFSGVVINKAAQPGEMISPVSAGGGFTRTGICTIVDMDSLEIEVDVNESYINRVSAGQPVTATLNSYPDWKIPAEVITIIPAADRNRATVRVRIRLLERDARVLPDMGVKVAFMGAEAPALAAAPVDDGVTPGLYVPASAILQDGNAALVYVVDGDFAASRGVSVGEINDGRRRVLSGVSAGERVVVNLSRDLAGRLESAGSVVIR